MKRSTLLVFAIVLLATALRLHRVAEMPLRADEAASLYLALKDPQAIIHVFVTEDPHMPLYFLVLHFWSRVAGQSELAVRFPAIFVGVVSVAMTYVLGRQIFPFRRNSAWLGALLMAINPFLIWDAQDVYMYSFLTTATLISCSAFLQLLQARVRWVSAVTYVIAGAAALYLHYFFVFVLLAQFAIGLYWFITRRISARQAVVGLGTQSLVIFLFAPWLVVAWQLLTTFHSDFIPPADLSEMLQRALLAFTVGRADTRMAPAWVEPTTGLILAFGFLVIYVVGLLAPSKKNQPSGSAGIFSDASEAQGRIVLALLLGVPLLAFFVYSLVRFPLFDERYVLYVSFAFSLAVARGLANLWNARWWASVSMLAFIVLADSYALGNYFYVPQFARSPDWHGFTQQVTSNALPGDVLIQNYPDPALPYYLQERMPRVLLPRTGSSTMDEVSTELKRLTGKYNRLWVQPAPFAAWDTAGLVSTWLNRHARQVTTHEFRGVNLALYLPGSIALRQARSIDATFANRVRLLAFDADAALKPGAPARLTLYWKSLGRAERDATVFVHLYDDSGALWSQQDNQPVNGTYPISQWDADTIVVDSYVLAIPADAPAGRYSLMVGMYDSQTQTRQSIVNARGQKLADDRVMLTGLEVRR